MAELATIARPYAEALFKSASTAHAGQGAADLGSTSEWLESLASIAADPQLQQLAQNPNVSGQQIYDVIAHVSKSTWTESTKNFLRAVIDNGRLGALPEIAEQFRALVNQRGGSSDAVVYSAFPIDTQALAEVSAALQKRFGRKLNLSVTHEPALIGGIRVVVGDEVLDTSIKARLEQMKTALTA